MWEKNIFSTLEVSAQGRKYSVLPQPHPAWSKYCHNIFELGVGEKQKLSWRGLIYTREGEDRLQERWAALEGLWHSGKCVGEGGNQYWIKDSEYVA